MSLLKSCNGSEAPAPIDLTQGLVAHYLLNNNADDSYGAYDLVPIGTPDMQGDKAYYNGTTDLHHGPSPFSSGALNAYTISAWCRPSDISSTNGRTIYSTFYFLSSGYYYGFFMRFLNGFLQVAHCDGGSLGTGDFFYSSYSFSEDTLYHLVVTFDGTYTKLYVDDVLRDNVDLFNNVVIHVDGVSRIGCSETSGHSNFGFFTGDIANVRVYNEAKNQAFIDELYAEGYYPKPLPLPTTNGLVAHYPLTGTAEDETGNYDGTEYGGLTYVDDAEFGSVANFDGVDDGILVANSPSINITDKMTILVWVKPITHISTRDCIIHSGDSVSYATNVFVISYNIAKSIVFYGGSGQVNSSLDAIATNEWRLVAVRVDGSALDFFSNGVPWGSGVQALGTSATKTIDIGIDRISDGSAWPMNGNLRDLRIYNRPLLQQEIIDIYNYEKNFRLIDIDDGLVAYYPLANNSLDNYKNQYDGVDTSMTYDGLSGVFNGSASHIIASKNAIAIGAKTITFWMKRTASGLLQIMLCTNGTTTGKHGIDIRLNTDNTIGFSSTYASAGNHRFIMSHPLVTTLNQWHFISCRWDGTTNVNGVQLRIDASIVYSTATLTESVTSTDDLYIGTSSVLSAYFSGYKSYIRSVNKALTDEQIDVIYNTEKGDFGL